MMRVLDRGSLMKYCLCKYSGDIFAGVVVEVVVNLMYCGCPHHHQFQSTLHDECIGGLEVESARHYPVQDRLWGWLPQVSTV